MNIPGIKGSHMKRINFFFDKFQLRSKVVFYYRMIFIRDESLMSEANSRSYCKPIRIKGSGK